MFGTVFAVLIVGVNDRFGIAVCVKAVAKFFQSCAELEVVVNLSVENNPRGTIAVMNWLLSGLQVDYCQAPHAQTDRSIKVETIIVRPAMPDSVAHPADQILVHLCLVVANDAYD